MTKVRMPPDQFEEFERRATEKVEAEWTEENTSIETRLIIATVIILSGVFEHTQIPKHASGGCPLCKMFVEHHKLLLEDCKSEYSYAFNKVLSLRHEVMAEMGINKPEISQ